MIREISKKRQGSESGFGVIALLIAVAVVGCLGAAGWVVYRHNHGTTLKVASNTSAKTVPTTSAKTRTEQPVNPYAGWETYTDSQYHYSFMYPSGWTLSSTRNVYGETLLSPAQTVDVVYEIIQPVPVETVAFTPTLIDKLSSANEDLTVVGGYSYSTAANAYSPGYVVVDSSTLGANGPTVGASSQFAFGSSFVTLVGNTQYVVDMNVVPTNKITTLSDAQAWLNSTDAITGRLILESIKYNG